MGLNNFLRPARDAKEESERNAAKDRESAYKAITVAINKRIALGKKDYRFNDDDYDEYSDHYWDDELEKRFKDAGYVVGYDGYGIAITWY